MRLIEKQDWQSFRSATGWDGEKFEDLVKILLTQYSGRQWEQTKKSWDGSKDFVLKSDCYTAWAECKMFDSALPLKGVAPTLVMASVSSVYHVIIFSFSPITRTAVEATAQFAWKTGQRVQIYSDRGLDYLILHCEEARTRYFQTLAPPEHGSPEPTIYNQVWSDVDETYLLAQSETAPTASGPRICSLSRHQLFRVDLTVHNTFPLDCTDLTLDLKAERRRNFKLVAAADQGVMFGRTQNSLQFSLDPGEVRSFSFIYRLVRAKSGVPRYCPAPSLIQSGQRQKPRGRPRFRLSEALRTPLVGRDRKAFVETVRRWTDGRRGPLFMALHGVSGAGKTRLLEELREPLLANGYRTTALNGATDGRDPDLEPLRAFIPALTRTLLLLPPFPARADILALQGLARPPGQEGSDATVDPQDLFFLLNPPSDLGEEQLAALAMDVLVPVVRALANGTALFIDNLQDYSDPVARFIGRFAETIRTNGPRCVLAVSVNTQTWSRRGATELLLRSWEAAKAERDNRYMTFALEDFDREAFGEFIEALLTGGERDVPVRNSHKGLWDVLWTRVEPRPLHLEQALLHARDQKMVILEADTGFLRVCDEAALVDLFGRQFVSAELGDLMARRWRTIEADWSRHGLETRVMAFQLLCFCGRLDGRDARDLGIGEEDIEDFVSRGLARRVGAGLAPYHRQTQRIFHDAVFRFSQLTGACVRQVADHFLAGRNGVVDRPTLRLQKFTADVVTGRCTAEQARWAARQDRLAAVEPQELTFLYAARDLAMSPGVGDMLTRAEQIALLLQACEGLRHVLPRREGQSLFEAADTFVLGLLDPSETDTDVARFHAHYGNQMLVGHDDERLLTVLEEASTQIAPDCQDLWFRSYLADRLCVAHKSLGNAVAARRAGGRALRYAMDMPAEDNRRREREVFAYLDIANIYQNGHDLGPVDDICQRGRARTHLAIRYWRKAYDVFRRMPSVAWPKADFMPMVMLYVAQSHLLAGDTTRCRSVMGDALRQCRDQSVAFFGVKLHMIAALSYMLEGEAALPAANGEASQALNWALAAEVDRYIWACWWLKGTLLLREHHIDQARDAYERAARTLDHASSEDVKLYHYHFYDDAILQGRRHGWFDRSALIDLVVPATLRPRYVPVLAADTSAFADILARYHPTARFTDGTFNLPSP